MPVGFVSPAVAMIRQCWVPGVTLVRRLTSGSSSEAEGRRVYLGCRGTGLAAALSIAALLPAAAAGLGTRAAPERGAPTIATVLPRCAPKAYAYELNTNGAQGAVILAGHVEYLRGRECRVRDLVVLRLTDSRGRLLRVRGNAVRTWIGAVVGPKTLSETHLVLYAWRNWCVTSPRSYAFTVSAPSKFARFHWHIAEPSCVNASEPSTLRRFTDHG